MLSSKYETDKVLNEYLFFHYGKADEVQYPLAVGTAEFLDFPKRCADVCIKHFVNQPKMSRRALDLGCGVGRSTFELALEFDKVIGVDYSQTFISTCNTLKKDGILTYSLCEEGDIVTEATATVDSNTARERARFQQGDACNLPSDLGQFDCVLACNLIDRLCDPFTFLGSLPNLVAKGGIVVLASPYTWLQEFTPRKKWLGGYYDNDGNAILTSVTLQEMLLVSFDLIDKQEMVYIIRETARQYEFGISQATVWKRR